MKGQFMLIGVLLIMFLLAGMLMTLQNSVPLMQEKQSVYVDQEATITNNIENELVIVTQMDPTNETRISDFENFSTEYAAEKGYELNISD